MSEINFEEKSYNFWNWLKNNGATLSDNMAIKDYRSEGAGRGIVATKAIKEGELLFSIPRPLLLSQLTSNLNTLINDELNELEGWSPLILCMMYESQKEDSLWKPYFDVLPRQFNTPMFWNQQDLKELEGTDIIPKIGREEAESLFDEQIKPIIKNHPDVFDEKIHNVELFHICGSLIMAYSFHDELVKLTRKHEDESEDDEEEEEEGLIAMVPMADMLNHKTGYNNARLFHESDSLQMKAIKDIEKDEQIYNTYGELCNADLLRKYGFADENNPFDIVELDGTLVVNECCPKDNKKTKEKKIDFLMEEGALDDCFVIDSEHEIPEELIVSVHVLCATPDEFKKMEESQKLPKPRLTQAVKTSIKNILKERMSRYATLLEDDIAQLEKIENTNKKNALLVKVGEKKILKETSSKLEEMPVVADKRPASNPPAKSNNQNKKQKNK